MTHPIVQKFLNKEMDAGGTIAALEAEINRLEKENRILQAEHIHEYMIIDYGNMDLNKIQGLLNNFALGRWRLVAVTGSLHYFGREKK